MQKENTKPTQEEKEQYFAAHWSVPCINNDQWIWRNDDKFKDLPYGSDISECYSVLKPLSSITDEDAISLAELILKTELDGAYVVNDIKNRRIFHKGTYTSIYEDLYCRPCAGDPVREMPYSVVDFLRSKGYALPWRNYSVEQLISFGWLKLKQKGGDQDA